MDAATTKRARTEAKRMFTRAANALEGAVSSEAPLILTLERRFAELKLRCDAAQSSHDEYVSSLGDKTDEEIVDEDVWIEALSERFNRLEEETDKCLMESVETKSQVQIPRLQQTTIPVTKASAIQLERIKINAFDGDIRKYPKFRDEFFKHVKPLCSESQLPFVLKSYLKEEVYEDVDDIDDDFDSIWERLDLKYGNTGKLIDTIMADIKHLSICDNVYSAGTLSMIKTVEKAHRDLIRLGQQSQMDNATIVSVIEEKLPEEISNEWIKMIAVDPENHTRKFPVLMKLLVEWRCRIEYKVATIREVDNLQSGSSHHGQYSGKKNTGQTQRQKCWIHKETGDHPIWRCRQFQSKPVADRIEMTKTNKACFSCLEVGHSIDNCTRGFGMCKENGCTLRHNRLLHDYQVEGISLHTDTNDSTILPLQKLTIT